MVTPQNPYQVSNSFNAEQLRLLKLILDTMLQGGDVVSLRRLQAFNRLYAKIHKMHGKLEAQLVAGGAS